MNELTFFMKSVLIFILLYYFISIPPILYLVCYTVLMVLIFIRVNVRENTDFYRIAWIIFLVSNFTYYLDWYIKRNNIYNIVFVLLWGLYVVTLIMWWCKNNYTTFDRLLQRLGKKLCYYYNKFLQWLRSKFKKADTSTNMQNFPEIKKADLFDERKKDLERIRLYLQYYNSIGLEASWGQGKTFVTEFLENEYLYLKIEVISCNLTDIQSYVLNRIDELLKKKRIISKHSSIIRKITSTDTIIDKIYNFFLEEDASISEIIEDYKRLSLKLDKKILIVIEDIDRIDDVKRIKEIFNIGDKLSSDNIKIIYHYDMDILADKEITKTYLEKYIPNSIKLTPLHFFQTLEYVLDNTVLNKNLKMEDFHFIQYNHKVDYISFRQSITNTTVRQIEHFVKSINIALDSNKDYIDYKRSVIAFFLVKFFMEDIYFEFGEHPCFFQYCKNLYIEADHRFSNKNDNHDEYINKILFVTNLFNVDIQTLPEEDNINQRIEDKQNNAIRSKIEQIINHLMYESRDNYTKKERYVLDLQDEVLIYDDANDIKQSFEKFEKEYSSNNTKTGRTLHLMGIDPMHTLFDACYASNVLSDRAWINLIHHYRTLSENDTINMVVIQSFSLIRFQDVSIFFEAIRVFNELKIVGNFNDKCYFYDFLNIFMSQLLVFRLGPCQTYEILNNSRNLYEKDSNQDNENAEELKSLEKDVLRVLILDEKRVKEMLSVFEKVNKKATEELQIICDFINHILNIMRCEYACTCEEKPQPHMSAQSVRSPYLEEIRDLPTEEQKKQLNILFNKNEITLYEFTSEYLKLLKEK